MGLRRTKRRQKRFRYSRTNKWKNPNAKGCELAGRCRVVCVSLLGLAVTGCSSTVDQCVKPDGPAVSSKGTASAIPEGFRIEGSPSGSVQAISCENGRQGYVIADVEWVSFQASE
jgi:hypothetical protein